MDFMTKQTVDEDTAQQVMDSFKILAGDKVCHHYYYYHYLMSVIIAIYHRATTQGGITP